MSNTDLFIEIKMNFPNDGQPLLPLLLKTILELTADKDKLFYFRGESKIHPLFTPSLYRNKDLVLNGSEYYYRSLISEMGRDDYIESTSLVRLMAELRHYEGLTRHLDVSRNPLTAIFNSVEKYSYSATNPQASTPGVIYIFETTKEDIKFDTGHTIAIKTALNLIPQDCISRFLDACDSYDNIFSKYSKKSGDEPDTIRKKLLKMELNQIGELREVLIKEETQNHKELVELNADIDSITEFMDLLNQRARVKENLKYPFSIHSDLIRAHLFIPSMNTDRIKLQRGAFIFPAYLSTDNSKTPDANFKAIQKGVHDSICKYLYSDGGNKIIIPSESKNQLRKELYQIGIDEGFLYADIKHQSDVLSRNL